MSLLSSILKGAGVLASSALKVGAGAGLYYGASAIADNMQSPDTHVGSLYTGGIKALSFLGGAGLGLSAVTGITKPIGLRIGAYGINHDMPKLASFGVGMANLSSTGLGLAAKGLGRAGKFVAGTAGDAVVGLAKAPFLVAGDIGRMITGRGLGNRTRTIGQLATLGVSHNVGARSFGWGAMIGAGFGAIKGKMANMQRIDHSVAMMQMYDPSSMAYPQNVQQDFNTEGLVQALHTLR